MKKKKETKLEELERRVQSLEGAVRLMPTTVPQRIGMEDGNFYYQTQPLFYCRWCGGWVSFCPGHILSWAYC